MSDWFNSIKGLIKDVHLASTLEVRIDAFEERIAGLKETNGDLIRKLSDLEAQLVTARADLALKTDEAAKLEKEVAKLRQRRHFDIISGIAFERDEKHGHRPDPKCPNCFSYLSHDRQYLKVDYECPACRYKVSGLSRPDELVRRLLEMPG